MSQILTWLIANEDYPALAATFTCQQTLAEHFFPGEVFLHLQFKIALDSYFDPFINKSHKQIFV